MWNNWNSRYLCNFSVSLKNNVSLKKQVIFRQSSEEDLGFDWMLCLVRSEVEEGVYVLAWRTEKVEGPLGELETESGQVGSQGEICNEGLSARMWS